MRCFGLRGLVTAAADRKDPRSRREAKMALNALTDSRVLSHGPIVIPLVGMVLLLPSKW